MKKINGSCRLSLLTASIFAVLYPAESVLAQAARSGALEEVIVTARKREESIQEIPVAISAYSGTDLTMQGAVTIPDIAGHTPNFFFQPSFGNATTARYTIRGQTQPETVSTLDQAIGTYIDGVYRARPVGAVTDLVDIARVEILRGSQGTLFGRNTTGGAISITTNDPELNQFGGNAGIRAGNYGIKEFKGVVNIPLVDDEMAARLAYSKRKSDGFIKNVTQNRDVWDDDQDTVVGKLLWRPTDTFELVLKGDYYKKDAANYGGVLGYVAPGSSAAGYIQFITGGTDSMSNYITDDYYTSYDDSALYAEVKETGAAAIATWDLDPLTVKFIYGYRELDYATNMDLDGTPYFVMDSTTALEGHRSQSAELQFLGSAMEDRLDWIVGLFYFVENGRDGSVSVAMPLLNPGSPTISDGEVENRSNAIFAQGTYQLTDAVSLTLGLRYSDESRELVSFNRNGAGCTIAPSLRDAPGLCQSSQTFDDSSTDYLFTINYQPVDFISTYFKVATGFRSGGLNLRGTNEATFQPFKSESVTDYEIGMKADWLDRRLRTNIAFFYSDYQDIQRNVITASFNPDGSVAGSNTVFSNAAAGTVKGAELEISALPFDNLELSASFGYTDASYDKYPDTFTSSVGGVVVVQPFDRSNEPYVSVPEYTWSLAATHRYDTPIGELTTRVDYMWKDEVMTQAPTRPDETPDSLMAKELGLLNARIGLTVGDTGLNVGIWGRNLTDEDSNVYNLSMLNSLGHVLRLGNQPRTYGVEVNYTF